MLPSFCTQTIQRVRPTATKIERGSEVPDWEHISTITISNVSIQPQEASISQDGRVLGIRNAYKVYANPGTDIKAGDMIMWNDGLYLVDEVPRVWTSPTGKVSNIQFNMTEYKG